MEPQLIREGYLVKKRTLLSSWKVVWVVLLDDAVEVYKKKADISPRAMIPLKGARVASLSQDFSNRMFVFKMSTARNQEHYFQASHVEERQVWTKDLKRAISRVEEGVRFSRRSTRNKPRDGVSLSELYSAMRRHRDGLTEMKVEVENQTFHQCFSGSAVIDWLVSQERAGNREEALLLATGLLNEGFLQPAGELSKHSARVAAESVLLDCLDALYYFVDSGFFITQGDSSDEDIVVNDELRGIVVKQGCLLKQGHKRKNWKVRKFILRQDPPYLHYYDPTKDGQKPLGVISLRGSVVSVMDSVPDDIKHDLNGFLFEIITSNETHYFLQATTSSERKEWIQAIHAASKAGR